MDKLKMLSDDGIVSNIEIIAKFFPSCITETKNSSGNIERAVDFDKLKAELSYHVIDDKTERYQFTWPDKFQASRLAHTSTSSTLRPYRAQSVDFDHTQNLYIEGDNLEVLKVLRHTYAGKIKMIYIDPPYNTGNDFVYNDDFAIDSEQYQLRSGQKDESGRRLVTNKESNGRFHTDWLNMIYPRLKLARELLSEDGVIFISIDDNEIDNLKKVCIELYGENNFIGNIIWQSRTSISNDREISSNHNHTLVLAKNHDLLSFGGDDINSSEYKNPDGDPRGPWKLVPLDGNHLGGNTIYKIKNPLTGREYLPPKGRCWCYNESTMQSLIADGRVKFGLKDDSSPKRKLFLNERIAKGDCKTPSSILLDAGTTKNGTNEIEQLFKGAKIFDYPKPTSLILKLIKYGYVNNDDIVLDFFSGSATTAHAVMKLNASDNGKRKFIMVQLPEDLPVDSAAFKAGYKNICEIGKERIRRAGAAIKEEMGALVCSVDTGFRVLKLDSSNMQDTFYSPQEYSQASLLDDNIKPDRSSEDLLFQSMLETGALLSESIEVSTFNDKQIFNIAEGYLLACFDHDLDIDTITYIAKINPVYFICRDASLCRDAVADNIEQVFKAYSPDTICKVL